MLAGQDPPHQSRVTHQGILAHGVHSGPWPDPGWTPLNDQAWPCHGEAITVVAQTRRAQDLSVQHDLQTSPSQSVRIGAWTWARAAHVAGCISRIVLI